MESRWKQHLEAVLIVVVSSEELSEKERVHSLEPCGYRKPLANEADCRERPYYDIGRPEDTAALESEARPAHAELLGIKVRVGFYSSLATAAKYLLQMGAAFLK